MATQVSRYHSPRLCSEAHCNSLANSKVVLDHELVGWRAVTLLLCERCAVRVAREDKELARAKGHESIGQYSVRDFRDE